MSEPIITCPKCQTIIPLTASLAAPLIEETKRRYEQEIEQISTQVEERESAIREKEKLLRDSERKLAEKVEREVEKKLEEERIRIIGEESEKAKKASAKEVEAKTRENAELHGLLKETDEKLTEALNEQAKALKKQRELDKAQRELELTIETRVQQGLKKERADAKLDAEEKFKFQVAEKEQIIASMQQKIEELQRKAEQGSQQLQGEVLELDLENRLRARFPTDNVEPVPKGEFGGDILHNVLAQSGDHCGTILWECKRTKNWSDGWLTKLRDNQRKARADISVLVSHALPKDIETFDVIDGVWITHPRVALPVAVILRNTLIQVSSARISNEGQQTKAEMIYQYLTGPRFRHRVEAIVEAFSAMQGDLEKERRAIMRQWAKRQEQIERVMTATVGMYGDLQGIAGKSLKEIDGLALDNPDSDTGVLPPPSEG